MQINVTHVTTAARRPLDVGIVGCGHVLSEHIQAWSGAPGCRIVGFYDLDPARAERAARQVPGATAFASYEAAVAACDVLDLASPPQVHHAQALHAITAGKHVLIEKPVTMTLAEWDDIAGRAAAAGVKAGAVHQLKFGSHIERALQWVRSGSIGEVVGVSCVFHVDTGSDPMLAAEGTWVNDLPGARWFEVLPHLLYLIHPFTGDLAPGKVTVATSSSAPACAPALDVVVSLVGTRCLGTVHLTARSQQDDRHVVIHGSQGTVDIALLRGVSTRTALGHWRGLRPVAWLGLPFLEAASTLAQWLPDRKRHLFNRFRPSRHGELVRAFADHVRGLGPSPTPPEEIRSVVACCEAFGTAVEAELRSGGRVDRASRTDHTAVPWVV